MKSASYEAPRHDVFHSIKTSYLNYNRKERMEQITITKDDYSKACSKAMDHMMQIIFSDGEKDFEQMSTFGMQFLCIQAEIYNQLFKEKEDNYA